MPDARLKDRQMTCGTPQCKRQWHRRKCAQWYKDNRDYFRANYLQKKLDAAVSDAQGPKALRSKLPLEAVQEVIGIQQLIIIEYFGAHLLRRFQEVIRMQAVKMTHNLRRLPREAYSRADGH
jgi:hypothetical protein